MYNLINLTLVLTFFIININGEYTSEDCASLGFSKSNLLCSVCDQLPHFNLQALGESCRECCNAGSAENKGVVKYAKARLEVCTCKFGAYPQVQAFVKSDRPGKFPNLSIRYVRGLDPIVKLMDADGNVVDTLAIEKWNTDSIEEFFTTYLEPAEEKLDLDYLKTNLV